MNHLKKAMLLAMAENDPKMLLMDANRIIDKHIEILSPESRFQKERMAADDILLVVWDAEGREFHMSDLLTHLVDEFEA